MIFPVNTQEKLIQRMARPFVSLLIRSGITHRRISELLKVVFVKVAAEEYGKGGRLTNVTRISMLTGLDRKQVKELRDSLQSENGSEGQSLDAELTEEASSQSSALSRVLSAWHQDLEFSTNGEPKALDIDTQFPNLCKRYGGDKTHTAILSELLRVSAIARVKGNQVVATSRYYMPAQTDSEALHRSLNVYRDLGNTLLHNLYREKSQPSRFEGRASSAHVPLSQLNNFRAFVEQEGQQFLEKIDSHLTEYENSSNGDEATTRVGLGMYWIEDQTEFIK